MPNDADTPHELSSWSEKEFARDVEHAEIELLERVRAEAVKATATLALYDLLKTRLHEKVGILVH